MNIPPLSAHTCSLRIARNLHLLLITTLITGMSILLPACGGKEEDRSGKVEITFWHSLVSSTVPALQDLIKKFEEEHPGITVKAQYVPTGDALIQKLVTAVHSNTAPDVSWIHANFMQDLIEADAIYTMEEFIRGPDSLPQADLQDIYPALMEQAKWRGVLYSMPMEATALGLLCNRELFRNAGLDPDQPPRDWNELRAMARKLTLDKNGDGKFEQMGLFIPIFPYSGPYGDWMVWQWYPFLFQAGGNVITLDQSRVLFDSPEAITALTLWKEIYNDLNLSSFTIDYEVAFASKTLAMAIDGPWNIPRWRKMKNLDWTVAPLPAGPARNATVAGGEYLSIFKQSRHPKETWMFVKWMLRPDVQAFWSMRSGYLPVRHAVRSVKEYNDYLETDPPLRAYVESMEFAVAPRPIDYHSLRISRHLAEALEQATLGRKDPATVLRRAAAESNRLLESVVRK
ncbi:MAG: ABC transporter substrate-binding protein [Bacteroidetes bacterium]|nr:ABC transporter substrate-binding protein [Bacteroidota bacterium]